MRSPACFSPTALVLGAALLAGNLAACGGAASGQAPSAAAPVEVVIAPPEQSAAPAAPPAPVASADAAPEGDAVASMDPEKRAKLEEDLSKLDMVMLGALSTDGGGNMGVLGGGQPIPGHAGLSLGGGGAGGSGIVGLVVPGGGTGGAPAGATVRGPTGVIAAEALAGAEGIPGAKAIIAGMTAGFRRCYNMGLQQDPTLKGVVTLSGVIGANGQVVSASASAAQGLMGQVVTCMKARLNSAMFQPPLKAPATLKIKVSAEPR